ncbi:ATP-dependent DNA helicase [Mycena sanguinolenta]|uniref:ATP-dependent DNA helicase n=1 Tax=Mycena sanguinolenta TaxID=230812 RepID=A0A8H7D7H3_9AGAR|nr:ATP-dependent DNA helicase [Mycena sanguinolenta]
MPARASTRGVQPADKQTQTVTTKGGLPRTQVTLQDCTAADGTVYLTCNECRRRRREAYAQARDAQARQEAADRDAENQGDGAHPDEDDEGVQTVSDDDYDAVFGDGSDLAMLDLADDSAVTPEEGRCLKRFDDELNAIKIESCTCCQEEGFNMKIKASGECPRCHSDRKDVKTWSNENNVNPMPEDLVPPCLKNLTQMEQMLISRVKPVMQNITVVAERLPRLPEEVDMVIIRQDGVNLEGHVDFMVRREKVRDALLWKIQHDPSYADLGAPDPAMLTQLPENGSVAHRIPTCRDGTQDGGGAGAAAAAAPTGPTEAAGAEAQDQEEAHFVGGGVLNIGEGMREEVVEVREGANAILQGPHYEQTIVQRLLILGTIRAARGVIKTQLSNGLEETCTDTVLNLDDGVAELLGDGLPFAASMMYERVAAEMPTKVMVTVESLLGS